MDWWPGLEQIQEDSRVDLAGANSDSSLVQRFLLVGSRSQECSVEQVALSVY